MSETLDKMIEEGKGYRTENYGGSNVRNIEDITRFEFSMGNTDIVEYVQKNYKICMDYIVNDNSLTQEKKLEKISDITMDNAADIVDEIIGYLEEELKSDNLYGLWLDTYDNVVKRYNCGSKYNIDKYPLNNNYVVISDLGEDGALFVFKEE